MGDRNELEDWYKRADEVLIAEEQKLEELKGFLGQLTIEESEQAEYQALRCPNVEGRDA